MLSYLLDIVLTLNVLIKLVISSSALKLAGEICLLHIEGRIVALKVGRS